MPSVHGSLKSLVGGVSQQPARDRLPGQCEIQENFLSDLVDGLVRRMGTAQPALLTASEVPLAFYNAQFDEQDYVVAVGAGTLDVWSLDGTPQTVDVEGDHVAYFTLNDRNDVRFAPVQITDNDGTDQALYIGNRTFTCQMEDNVPVLRTQDTVIQFLGGNYGRKYQIQVKDDVGGVIATWTYQSPDGSNPEHVHFVSGTAIASIFERLMRQGPGNSAGDVPNYRAHPYKIQGTDIGERDETGTYDWQYCAEAIKFNGTFDYTRNVDSFTAFSKMFKVTRIDDTILITPRENIATGSLTGLVVDGTEPNYIWDYDVTADDGEGGSTLALVRKDISDPSKLPRFAAENTVVRVVGGAGAADDYFLKFQISRPTGYFPRGVYESATGDDLSTGGSGDDTVFWSDGFDVIYGGSGTDTLQTNNVYDLTDRAGRKADAKWHFDPGQPDFVYMARYGDNTQIRGAVMIHRSIENIRNSNGDQTITWDDALVLAKAGGYPPDADTLGGYFRNEFVPLLTLRDSYNGFGRPGVWVESTSPFEQFEIDISTMPRLLVREDGVFKLSFGDWKPRRAGMNATNPVPGFIGSTIEDMVYFQSRLVLMTPDQLSMSRTGRYDDFWFQSGAASAKDDPIGIGTSARKKSRFRYMVQHNLDLVIFADNAQFVVLGDTSLTFENAQIIAATNYEADVSAAPAPAGDVVYYPIRFGRFTGVKEYHRLENEKANASTPVTAHVPRYIQGAPIQMLSVSNLNMLLVTASGEKNVIYVYQYLLVGEDRVQAAWHKWTFSTIEEIDHLFVVDSILYIVYRWNNGVYFTTMDLERQDDPVLDYQVCMDGVQRGILADTGPSASWIQTDHIPVTNGKESVRIVFESGDYVGMRIPVTSYEVLLSPVLGYPVVRWYIREDYAALGTFLIGAAIQSKFVPTMPMIKDDNGVVIDNAALIIRMMSARLEDTGYLRAEVSERYKEPLVTEFSGRFVGDPENQVGRPGLVDADFEFRVGSDSRRAVVTLLTDDVRPARILSMEWRGQNRGRGKRVNVE